jgi:hypothetical protein
MNAVEKKVLVTFVTLLNAYESFGEAVQALMKSTKHISAELHEALHQRLPRSTSASLRGVRKVRTSSSTKTAHVTLQQGSFGTGM